MSGSSTPPIGHDAIAGGQSSAVPPVPSGPPGQVPSVQPPRRRALWKRLLLGFAGLVFLGSIMLNFGLLMMLSVSILGGEGLDKKVIRKGKGNQVVAVFELTGVIGGRQVKEVEALCRDVREDKNVKAVVLRVYSPGGGVSASDQIYKMLKDLKEKHGKRFVVSMGGVAASGGYYVSAAADEIYAEPTTVTGSIGAIAFLPGLKGTLEKIGLKVVLIRSTKAQAWKAVPSAFEEPADYHLAELQKAIDVIHDRFEGVVRAERGSKIKAKTSWNPYVGAEGKKFNVQETEPYNGRIYSAEDAKKIGLVDKIGYQKDAIDAAAKLAGLSKPKVVRYKVRKSLRQELGMLKQSPAVSLKTLEEIQTPKLMLIWKVDQ